MFPTDEQVRAAIEKVVQKALYYTNGSWEADLSDGQIEFQPKEDGTIEATMYDEEDEDEEEKTYKFRVRVELA